MAPTRKVKENGPAHWRIPPLQPSDNKYTRGHVLIYGGATMTGAARLSAHAAQRAGAGLVTLMVPKSAFTIYATSMLSVIVRPFTPAEWNKLCRDKRVNPILIGPGAGIDATSLDAIKTAIATGKTLVLDADALTQLATHAALRNAVSKTTAILTPHEGEFARLAIACKLGVNAPRETQAMALAKSLNAILVLKGSTTLITDGKNMLASHPPAWLASGGTGDVLAGIIASLVGQGMPPLDAAAAGVWLHAKAASKHGRGMIAEDIIASLPTVLREKSFN